MNRRRAWIAALLALGTAAALRRRPRKEPAAPHHSSPLDDPAEALRRKLEESKGLASERERFEAGETPVDQAIDSAADLEERRRRIHESGAEVVERMRSTGGSREP